MRTKSIVLLSIICFFTNISGLFAGTWVKKTETKAGANENESEVTNDKTPESSNEGLYAKNWADGNDVGISITGWLLTRDKISPSINEITGGLGAHVTQGFQWSERNPPRMVFSCDWTEVLYVQNKGNCDNGALFNNKGMVKAQTHCDFNFDSGPENTVDTYRVGLYISSENRENKVRRSPEVQLGMTREDDLIGTNWDNKPDKKKSWNASGGNIVSYSVGMDNLKSDNIYVWGAIGSGISVELQNKAKSSLAGIFQELSGFDLVTDNAISNEAIKFQRAGDSVHFSALEKTRHIWYGATYLSRLSPISTETSMRVSELLNQRHLEFNSQSVDENLVTESVKRYLEQFAYTFAGENEEQACYYMAWLLAEAATRPIATSEDITNTRVSLENLIDRLTSVLNENAKQAIGDANLSVIQEELNENLARVKGRLLYYFYKLRDDPLFPVFKKPIDNEIEETIIKKFENEKILFNLLNNQVKSEPVSEFYRKWLSFYFDRVAERVVFWLAIETNKDEFRNPQYWGGMHYRARSCRNGLWPVEIYLRPIENKYP